LPQQDMYKWIIKFKKGPNKCHWRRMIMACVHIDMLNRICITVEKKLERTCWHDEKGRQPKEKNKFVKTSQIMEGFSFVIFITVLTRCDAGKDDDFIFMACSHSLHKGHETIILNWVTKLA
jgi:hypothetical protein